MKHFIMHIILFIYIMRCYMLHMLENKRNAFLKYSITFIIFLKKYSMLFIGLAG